MFCKRKTLAERLNKAKSLREDTRILDIVAAVRKIRKDHERFQRSPIGADREMRWQFTKDVMLGDIKLHIYSAIRADLIEISRNGNRLMEYVDQHYQYSGMLGTNDMEYVRVSLGKIARAISLLVEQPSN